MALALKIRNGRVVFVECLTDAKAKPADIERKKQLSKFGELCFVVVGGHGCHWKDDEREIPGPFNVLARQTDVLTYFYGHWQNAHEKYVSHLTKFPKTSFDIGKSNKIEIAIALEPGRKTANAWFEFTTKPYNADDEREFVLDIACRLAWQVGEWREFSTPARINMRAPSGKVFRDGNNTLVAQICCRDCKGLLKIRGPKGVKVLARFLSGLRSEALTVKIDQKALATVRRTLAGVTEKSTLQSETPDPIESNLYETDQIVWILTHFFENRPTSVAEFLRYLTHNISSKLSYWLRRASSDQQLQEVGPKSRLLKDRVFIATDSAIERTRRALSTVERGECGPKGVPYEISHYVKHGNYSEGTIK